MTTVSNASTYRTKKQIKENAERAANAVPVELPSGNTFLLCRPPLDVWLSNGRAPQFFTQQALAEQPAQPTNEAQTAKLSGKETLAFIKFQREVVLYSVVAPSLRAEDNGEPLGENALLLSELDEADFSFIFSYAMNASQKNPIQTQSGSTTVEAVSTFRDGEPGAVPAASGADVSPVG